MSKYYSEYLKNGNFKTGVEKIGQKEGKDKIQGVEKEKPENHFGLVHHHVNKFHNYNPCLDRDDLFQEGCIGLMKACEKFNPDYGVKFATYATRCIVNEILMAFRRANRSVGRDKPNMSLDWEYNGDSSVQKSEFHEVVADGTDVEFNIIVKHLCHHVLNDWNDDIMKKVAFMYIQGVGATEMGRKLKISQSYASRLTFKIREKAKKYYYV